MGPHVWAVFIASFLASCVEFVEAFTIVLVIGVTVNWKSSLAGAGIAVAALAVIIAILGTAIVRYVPIDTLRLIVGLLLVLFGLKWIKKAVLRYGGLKAMHDEEAIYERWLAEMKARGVPVAKRVDAFGVVASFKGVLLEGLEVAFIVITFGAQAGTLTEGGGIEVASTGAAIAFVLVLAAGALVRAPLQRVPENTLKFVVGIMLTTFGTFWGGEGLGVHWWGNDLFLIALALFYLVVSGLMILWIRSQIESSHTTGHRGTPSAREARS